MRTQHLKVTVTSLQNISSLLSLSQEKPFGSIFVSPHFIISTGCLVSNKTQLEVQLPTRIDCLCVGMVVKGCPEPIINQCRYQLAAGDLLIVNWGAILDSEKFSNDIVVKGFAVTEDYLRKCTAPDFPTSQTKFQDMFIRTGEGCVLPVSLDYAGPFRPSSRRNHAGSQQPFQIDASLRG